MAIFKRSNPAQHSAVFYTRQGCCLCDEALELLHQEGLKPQIVDIDKDPELHARFTDCLPVVEIDGKVRFRGRVEPRLLRRLLRRPPTR